MFNIKSLILACAMLLLTAPAFATGVITPAAGGANSISIRESDGSPSIGTINGLIVTNGSLTDNGDGTATVATNGATNVTIGSSTITGGTASSLLYVGAGPVLQQVSISGLVLGNGASAPTAYAGVTCTNQVLRILSSAGAGTCVTLTSAYVDSSIITNGGALGTPSSGTLTNATGLPVAGLSNLGANVGTFLVTPTGANFQTAVANYAEEVGTNGIHVRTAADTWAGRTITGTSNETLITNGDGVSGNPVVGLATTLNLSSKTMRVPNSASLPGTCTIGDVYYSTSATLGQSWFICTSTNVWTVQGDGGGGGSIGGSTGSTDKAIIVANGTGGATIQASTCTITSGAISCPSGVQAGVAGTGVFTMLEGTPPGAGTNAGEHNLYFDSSDSGLKSQENGGSVQIYAKTNMNLSSFAATSSAQLSGLLNDETGSGLAVFGTTPTIVTPVITGAISFPDGTRQTFNPDATNAGLNIGSQAGLVSSPQNGDIWYDSTGNKYKCRENGVTVDCISTGAGSGDVTDVVAGTGIAVATPGGPAPTVSWSPVTQVASFTMFDSANASRTITFGLSGATDPVWTIGDNSMDLTTGVLKQGGVAVDTASATNTLTNKTLDAEGTGNVITLPKRIWFPAAGCNNATAGSVWDLPTSNPAVAACVTGTNTQKGVLDFADASNLSAQLTYKLPSTWVSGIDANVKWFSSTTSGDVVWQIALACVADAETDDPAFTDQLFTADTTKGTTNQTNDASKTSITTTGSCAAGELMHIRIKRDSADAGDTMAGTARLIGVELVIREAI